MSAGQPDWSRLHAMGKLPKEARGNVPLLQQLDSAEKEIKRLHENMCDECKSRLLKKQDERVSENAEVIQLKCPRCPAMVGGRGEEVAKNNLGKHVASAHPKTVKK